MQQTQKGFNQHEKSAFYCSGVNLFVEVSSSTDNIVGTVTKNLLEIQQKNLSALMKILSSICYLGRQRLPLTEEFSSITFNVGRRQSYSTFRNDFKPIHFTSHSKLNFKRYGNAYP